jgi:uncharacterized protein (DUF305 family)
MFKEGIMKKEAIVYGTVGLAIGAIIAGTTAMLAVNDNNTSMMKMMGMHTSSTNDMLNNDDMSMSEMTSDLQGKSGDDFDKAFINDMITHHQGAIDMAKLAKVNAKHDEIKKMANDIISAQSKEIDMMQTWQGDWGYKTVPKSHEMMSH